MKAMILAAGLGTRLQPLTNDRPKALVEINGRTLLEITIRRLAAYGVSEIIVNVHHFADQVAAYLQAKSNFGLRIEISWEDDLLLDTGGGLKKASWFFDASAGGLEEPFLVHNVDVLSNIEFHGMLQLHSQERALATLAVQSRESSRQLLFNPQLQLRGRRINEQDTIVSARQGATVASEARNVSGPLLPLAFSGIHVISPRIFPLLSETGVFSIIDSYMRLAAQGEKIVAFRHDNSYWRDLGRVKDLKAAAQELR